MQTGFGGSYGNENLKSNDNKHLFSSNLKLTPLTNSYLICFNDIYYIIKNQLNRELALCS